MFYSAHPQSGSVNIRIVVMNNLLPSSIRYHEKYDLKGSTYKRRANSAELGKKSPTFKDLDFVERHDDVRHPLLPSLSESLSSSSLSFVLLSLSPSLSLPLSSLSLSLSPPSLLSLFPSLLSLSLPPSLSLSLSLTLSL